ncbi:MAG: efflux RND transporter periplasmic adaptor subunit [Bdellovibrionota bacterium]
MKLKKTALIAISLIILLAAGTVYFRLQQYDVIHPTHGDITEAVYGLGKVKSDQRFEVIVGVISTVTNRFVAEGDFVKKGAPLIEFDHHALFRAPFDGTVTLAALYPGETALPHVPTLRLEDLRNRYIELSLEQQAALRVRKGQGAKVSFESLRGHVLTGKVTALYPREDEFLARIFVPDLEGSILPSMTADVSVEIGQIHNALLIPLKSVQNGMVTVLKNNHWQKVKVDVGHVDGLSAEITGGVLSPNDALRIRKEN